jgi:hypothetical protein
MATRVSRNEEFEASCSSALNVKGFLCETCRVRGWVLNLVGVEYLRKSWLKLLEEQKEDTGGVEGCAAKMRWLL